jgi:hypothetical protein
MPKPMQSSGRPPWRTTRDWQPVEDDWMDEVTMDCRARDSALVERLRAHHPERETVQCG